jgi:hypothetical protein
LGPRDPEFRVRAKVMRLRPDSVNYWEGALQLLFYIFCLKKIDHGSRTKWGQVLLDPDYGSENVINLHL